MFKVESYITPILLSYVDKYIKNFRSEDSQVSLWGGDALFHNLDLRLEVLEQELQLPFSFTSGHIHQLQIHVPWTKLTSEPITITINTIECILKLKGDNSQGSDSASQAHVVTSTTKDSRKKTSKKQDVVAPSGYVQSLVNKIVSNITIICNNLILKYVEEDIVLSVNVKTVTLQSVNELWQPTFTEISPLLRKLINLADLTICLDKRNASGKIEMYQEPLLYRCSLDIHLLRSYQSATAKRASVTRVDIHCTRMDFSVTEQQIPMLMRLALLGLALHGRELVSQQSPSVDPLVDIVPHAAEADDDDDEEDDEDDETANESWAGWALSFIPSVLPYYSEEDWNSDQQAAAYGGHTYHTGFYVKHASVTLKITETTVDKSCLGPRKVRFIPFLTVQLQGCFMELIMQGVGWLNAQLGISRATVQPSGDCFCGVKDVPCGSNIEGKDNEQDIVYFTAGSEQLNYIAKSLFDPESQENSGQKRMYNVSWDYHLASVTEALLLERSPAIAVDYLYMLELPDDLSSEPLSDLVSDLEYSNLPEKSICRIVVGPTAVKLCSGLFHRLQMVHHYAKVYDYAPYSSPKSELNPDHLRPPKMEDFQLLEQNIPKQVFQLTLFKPVIHIMLADHPVFNPLVLHAPRKGRKKPSQIQPLTRHIRHLPKVTLECACLDAKLVKPMYPRRLVSMTCRHPSTPQHVFHACHFHTDIKLHEVNSQLVLGPGNKTKFLMPSNVTFTKQNLVFPNYWNNMDIPHVDHALQADSVTVTCTKSKLMVIVNILQSQFNPSSAVDIIQNSTLLTDAEKHIGVEYLELCIEAVTCRHIITPGTEAFCLIVGSVKAFVLEFPLKHGMSDMPSETQQALVLSGPDYSVSLDAVDVDVMQHPLLSFTMQYSKNPDHQDHPPVIIFKLREVCACVDPMMWKWLRYSPARVSVRHDISHSDSFTSSSSTVHRRNRRLSSETTVGGEAAATRRAPTPQESVHSSSDRDQLLAQTAPPLSPVPHSRITQSESEKQTSMPPLQEKERIWSRSSLLHWFPVWRGLVLSGDMAQCVVYLPTSSLSAVGSHSIEDPLAHCLKNKSANSPEVLVITFPFMTLRSAAMKQDLHEFTSSLPVKLPENIWTKSKISFPWSLAVSNMSCYTLQNGSKLHFLKPVSANATVGISAKYQIDESTLSSLGFFVHVDTTPVKISVSQKQVNLMAGVLVDLLDFSSSLQLFTFSYSDAGSAPTVDPPIPTSPTLFPESSGSRESPSTPFKTQESVEQHNALIEKSDTVKMTVLMQSTLARLTVSMYAESPSPSRDDLKLVIDMEDIMNSLDFQQVYLKVKCKIALANIKHYVRKKKGTEWAHGPHVGLVMRGHEDVASAPAVHRELDEGGGFLSLTFTRAKCRNVHSRWGTHKQTTLLANSNSESCQGSLADKASHHISEIVVKLQAVDFVFSASTLGNFLVVLYPILMMPECGERRKTTTPPTNWMLMINNRTLPLLYLDTHNVRVIVPAAELMNMEELHDVCLIQVDAVTLTPQADNPLGRNVIRTDIYHMAEQSRMLCVPGSDVEDRQYQIDVTGFSINTCMWKEIDNCLGLTSSQPTPALHTMSENPALEWNNLVSGKESIMPHMSLLPVISRLNLCIVAAPAIVYRDNILVCGHSLEVNAVTDIEISISTGQLLLASALATEIFTLFKPLLTDSTSKTTTLTVLPDTISKSFSALSVENKSVVYDSSRFVDSGVDCAEKSSADFGASTGKLSFKGEYLNIKESRELESNPALQHSQQNNLHKPLVPDSPFTEGVSKYSVSSRQGGKWNEHQNVPLEILLTAGKISFVLYELKDGSGAELHTVSSRVKQKQALYSNIKHDSMEDAGYEAGSEEGSIEDLLPVRKQVQPLIHILLVQPHTFLSVLPCVKKIQMSCFDVGIRMSEPNFVIPRRIPRKDDFSLLLLETKSGDPHPNTGILPSFLTVKWSQSVGKASVIDLEFGRPSKLYGSLSQWSFISAVFEKISQIIGAFPSTCHSTPMYKSATDCYIKITSAKYQSQYYDGKTSDSESPTKLSHEAEVAHQSVKEKSSFQMKNEEKTFDLRSTLGDIGSLSLASQQLIFQISGTGHGHKVVMSVANLKGTVSRIARGQVDRLGGNLGINSLMLTVTYEGVSRPLLNPWSCSLDVGLAWEPWLMKEASPQVQLTAESDSVLIDIGPEHLHTLEFILSEYKPFLQSFQSNVENSSEKVTTPSADQDQHYRDDLRAGAFQFVDANSVSSREDLPLPYQVVFWNNPPTMAWRYLQPRALTRVDIYPIPFKVASDSYSGQERKTRIVCSLQYWSECHAHYKPYVQFHLSESETCSLELPLPPNQVVACTWKVQLTLQSEDDDDEEEEVGEVSSQVLVSPRVLAACMRVDSFFSPHQVPRFQAALNFSLIQVSLYNHMPAAAATKPLPGPLKRFSLDELTPESQFFMSISLDSCIVYVCTWASGDVSTVEFSSHICCDVVDYAYLTQHSVIQRFQAKAQLTIADKKTLRCITKTISVRFGPAIGHTLGMSADLWTQKFKSFGNQISSVPDNECQVIISRYIICNNLSCPLRFGQASTDEDILLGTRQCHMYSWRSQKIKSVLRIGVEEGSWVWSQPFSIDTDGLQVCALADCGNKVVRVFVKVTSLSVTQKQVTLSGQLVVTNLLAESLEFQTVTVSDKSSGEKNEGQNFVAKAKSTPPSVLLDESCSSALRIRFHGLASAWSGDIPLRENTKFGQPWLVKVPLLDRGQFLSVWCHVICQPVGHGVKILAMVCPLYMIRSHLPIPAKVLIDTPGLKVHLETIINGCGEEQQLYCPGTIDHSHKLTFQLESDMPLSNPSVPLSYTMIDQRKFFKREGKDMDIEKILENIHESPKQAWPFVGKEYADIMWSAGSQPDTNIQVKYVPQSRYCSTLLVELQPWALLVNALGHSVALVVEGIIMCRVPHQGIVMPPKLETTFNLALELSDNVHASPPLRLDWGSSFYMPRISGLIPNNGNAQTIISCTEVCSVLSIASAIVEEMRILTVRANFVISNHTSLNLKVSALAIHEYERFPDFQKEENQKCIQTLLPFSMDNHTNGCPIVFWNVLGEKQKEEELALYIILNAGAGWSCPLRVGDGVMRRGFAVPTNTHSNGLRNDACSLVAHEHNGQVFLSIHPELHPQIIVHNKCRFKILCAEANPESDGFAVSENEHFKWWCSIDPYSSSHYTLPTSSKKFPEILTPGNWPRFVLALADGPWYDGMLVWSQGIIIMEIKEQLINLPGHGDVKVRIQICCHTVHITIETVSHIEISARDIRSRLIHHQEDTESVVTEKLHQLPVSASSPLLSSPSSLPQSNLELPTRTIESDTCGSDTAANVPPELSPSASSRLLTASETTNVEIENTIPMHIDATCFLKGFHITLIDDILKMSSERTEVILLSLDNIYMSLKTQRLNNDSEELNISVSVGDLQLDNQMFQRGGFDFPVILIGQLPKQHIGHGFSLSTPSHLLEECSVDSLVVIRTSLEVLTRMESRITAMKTLSISFGPLCTYIEDNLITTLYDFIKCFAPATSSKCVTGNSPMLMFVPVPQEVNWNSKQVAYPLRLRSLKIQPVSLLLTAHKLFKLYFALNHSPLQFPAFERCNLITTPYQLGHTVTTHYFLAAIFGAGWMLGSLELLGSPGGFARNLRTGLSDFVRLPYQGIFEGPWGFIVGMTHGSASLMKHVTAGTVSSVTNLAASVARNLDILTLDQEHLARTEELRRQRPQGLTQGLLRGLTGLGISLLGAVGGIVHHPLRSVMSDEPSTRGVVLGMGLGLVGAITKPLSGTAELVALTGQGLLHETGWTTMPEVRQQPIMEHAFSGTNSRLKYDWKLITGFGSGRHTLLHVTDATYITPAGTYKAITLILTTQALFLVDTEEDLTKRVLSLTELSSIDQPSDPTLLSFHLQAPVETEATLNARVVDFVRHTSGMVAEIGNYTAGNQSEPEESSSLGSPVNSEQDKNTDPLQFYVNPQSRNYFLSVLALAKRQSQGRGFSVL